MIWESRLGVNISPLIYCRFHTDAVRRNSFYSLHKTSGITVYRKQCGMRSVRNVRMWETRVWCDTDVAEQSSRPVRSQRRALVAAFTDDDGDDCCIPDRWRILRGGPGSARRPRHARSIRPGPPTRLCRRYGRTSPSAPSEGRGCTRTRMRLLERNVRKDVARTDGRTDGLPLRPDRAVRRPRPNGWPKAVEKWVAERMSGNGPVGAHYNYGFR